MNTLSNNKTLEEMSLGPGQYKLDDSLVRNKISFPFATNVQLQTMGGSVMDGNFVDVDSDLNNLTRKLSKVPGQQYNPDFQNPSQQMIHFPDGGPPEQASIRLTNNPFELKGVGINRWEPLFFDPQKNCIEPFDRNGSNTVLEVLDKHFEECYQ